MNELDDLDRRVREKLDSANEHKQLIQNHLQQRMAELDRRHQQFVLIADRLLREVVRPRFETVVSHFENAEFLDPGQDVRRFNCWCRLKHCERFPATGELSLILSHDERIENLLVIYRLEILPIFFRFLGSDQEAFPLESVDEKRLAEWIDERLLGFVDTYLRLEQADQYQSENLVTDPVCGMRINKLYSPAPVEDRGRMFYFCTEGCRSKFVENPGRYG
ncbi:MAG: YHS domain-containing protein [Isosphaerales bacterium]